MSSLWWICLKAIFIGGIFGCVDGVRYFYIFPYAVWSVVFSCCHSWWVILQQKNVFFNYHEGCSVKWPFSISHSALLYIFVPVSSLSSRMIRDCVYVVLPLILYRNLIPGSFFLRGGSFASTGNVLKAPVYVVKFFSVFLGKLCYTGPLFLFINIILSSIL